MPNHPTSLAARTAGPEDAAAAPRASASRAAILDAAMRVFLRHGYEGASMDMAAREAGVARRTLYNQFAGKQALFAAAVERLWAETRHHIPAEGADSGDPAQDLRRLARNIAEFWAPPEMAAFLRMVIGEYNRFPELAEEFYRLGKEPAVRALTAYLERLSRAGALDLPDPALAATQFLALLKEPLVWPRVMGLTAEVPRESFDAVIDGAVGMFLAYYGRK